MLEKANFLGGNKVFSSVLQRANQTAEITMKEAQMKDLWENGNLKMTKNKSLNERDYGDLVGLNKKETAEKFGDEQVHIWRRSFDVPPPGGESLKDTANRVIPYLKNEIMPHIMAGKKIIIGAHGNSIRAIVMHLQDYTPEQILRTEIGWCEPWIFDFENGTVTNLEIVSRPNSKSMSQLPD